MHSFWFVLIVMEQVRVNFILYKWVWWMILVRGWVKFNFDLYDNCVCLCVPNVISCFITTSNCRAHPESQVGTRLKLTGQKKIINIPWNLHCNYKLLYLPLRSLDLSDFFLSLSLSLSFSLWKFTSFFL